MAVTATRKPTNVAVGAEVNKMKKYMNQRLEKIEKLVKDLGLSDIDELNQTITDYKNKISSLEGDVKGKEKTIEELNGKIEELNNALNDYQNTKSQDPRLAEYRLNNALDKQKKAEAHIIKQKEEIEDAKHDIDIYKYIYKNIILETVDDYYDKYIDLSKTDSYEEAKKNSVGLKKAIKKAKKADEKGNEKGYAEMLNVMTELLNDCMANKFAKDKKSEFLERDAFKGKTSKQIIETIIDQQTSTKAIVKANKGKIIAVAASAFALLVAAGIAVGHFVGQANEKGQQANQNAIVANFNDLNSEINPYITSTSTNYDAIVNDYDNAGRVYSLFANGGASAQSTAPYAKSSRDVDSLTQNYNNVVSAKTNADSIITKTSTGEISATCAYQMAVTNYQNAVDARDYERAKEYGETIEGYASDLDNYYKDSSTSLTAMLDEVGMTMDEVLEVMNMIKNPTVSVEFDADAMVKYNASLTNKSVGGTAREVINCQYTKATGDVQLLVKCEGRKGSYINSISYKVDKELTVVDLATIMAPVENKDSSVVATAYTQKMDLADQNVVVMYNITPNAVGASTIYNGNAIAYQVEDNGEITILTTASEQKSYGKGADQNAQSEICQALLNKINASTNLNLEMNSEAENEL